MDRSLPFDGHYAGAETNPKKAKYHVHWSLNVSEGVADSLMTALMTQCARPLARRAIISKENLTGHDRGIYK